MDARLMRQVIPPGFFGEEKDADLCCICREPITEGGNLYSSPRCEKPHCMHYKCMLQLEKYQGPVIVNRNRILCPVCRVPMDEVEVEVIAVHQDE